MAVYEFAVTGKIEVDEDAVGVVAANKVLDQPGGKIDVEFGMRYREETARGLSNILTAGVLSTISENFHGTGWRLERIDTAAEIVEG